MHIVKQRRKYLLSIIFILVVISISIFLLTKIFITKYESYYDLKSDEIKRINEIINGMSIDEKIGQMIIGSYDNLNDITPIIDEYHLGGIILYKKNINTVEQVKADINSLNNSNRYNKVPLFIATDEEGGRVSRLPSELGAFDSALSIGDRNDKDYAFNSGEKIGKTLESLSFNLDFAPVLDIFSNPSNTVITDRAYGRTPNRVIDMGMSVIDGMHSVNMIATAKHFPGHGDTDIDSHLGLPIVNKTLEELNDFEFKPFIEAIEHKIDMIMIAHIILKNIDDVPSTLSSKVVTDILRNQLHYDGVVITDDMTMKAISNNFTIEDASVKAIEAGCDIVLVKEPYNSVLVFNTIKTAINDGTMTEDRLDDSVFRILSLKYKYDIIK